MAKNTIPTPVLFAAVRGAIQWMCPYCGYLHSHATKAKVSTVRCNHCDRILRVGFGFQKGPFSSFAYILDQSYDGYTANRFYPNTIPQSPIPGRHHGEIKYICPSCNLAQKVFLRFTEGIVVCKSCGDDYHVALLLWRPLRAHPVFLPLDWSVPIKETPNDADQS